MIAMLAVVLAGGTFAWQEYQHRRSEERLLERAREYWDARRLNDWNTVYAMEAETAKGSLAPDEVDTRPEWGKRIFSFELGKIERFDNYAEVEIKKSIILRELTKPISTNATSDVWTFMNGDWYHGVEDVGSSEIRKPVAGRVENQPAQPKSESHPVGTPTIKPDTFGL